MIVVKPDRLRFRLTYLAQRLFMLPLVWVVFRVLNRLELEGLEHLEALEGRSVILAPNHTSAWDVWVGCLWAVTSRRRFVARDTLAALAAPERVPTAPLRLFTTVLGAIFVDREQGVEQDALQDTARLLRDGARPVRLVVYPEGTRSKDGRLRRRGRPGIGWLQRQTGAPVLPIHHVGFTRMPGVGLRLRVRFGRPLELDDYQERPDELATWRAITGEVMDALRAMEQEANSELRLVRGRSCRSSARRSRRTPPRSAA